ncbi:hypothetical protein MOMA_03000 [Moraxella macacae 0408225]|uniref:DUF1653 domain-containing protein n=1 Tax=Moraxella macacae 0408225 TaxID=1230338 RepID=L2F8G6_9GAMM|nr:DUF1653 domain-containing protein [Moraxella macacae]ELA09337.1 hypothetical protein MOMA_03000 [Moraxella macacae 0408225]
MNDLIKTGVYRHYKGNLYQVLHIACHSETEEWFVVYRPLYGDDTMQQSVWVRPLAMFCESVILENQIIPRFAFVSDT